MQAEDVVKVSTKGQIVIPKDVRKRFGIEPGNKVMVTAGENAIVLKRVEDVPLEELSEKLSKATRAQRIDVNALVDEAIRWARRSK